MGVGNPYSDPRLMNEAARRIELQRQTETYTPEFAARLTENARQGPFLSPRTLLNLTAANAPMETVRLMNNANSEMAKERTVAKSGSRNRIGGWFGDLMDSWNFWFGSKQDPLAPAQVQKTKQEIDTAKEQMYHRVVKPVYDPIKQVTRVAISLAESPSSGINNFLFELNEDGTPPTGAQVASRLGKIATIVASAGTSYVLDSEEINQAFRHTEAGVLFRNWDRQGSGFMLPAQLQAEQIFEVMGIDPRTGEQLDGYAGRGRFGEFTTTIPLQYDLASPTQFQQPITLGGYITNLGWTGKRLPDGTIIEGKGANLDSWYGSLMSGSIDAVLELATDPSIAAGKALKPVAAVTKGTKVYSKLSAAQRAAMEGDSLIGKLYKAGVTIDDIPVTTKSWGEINKLRSEFGNISDDLSRQVDEGALTAAERDAAVSWRRQQLVDAETQVWQTDKLSTMIDTDARWQFLFDLVDQAKQKYADVDVLAEVIRRKIFRNRISIDDAFEIASASGSRGYKEVFLRAADDVGRGGRALPDTVQQLGAGRMRRLSRAVANSDAGQMFDRMIGAPATMLSEVSLFDNTARGLRTVKNKIGNLFRLAPGDDLILDGSAGQRMEAADSLYRWLRNLYPNKTDDEILERASRFTRHLRDQSRQVDTVLPNGEIVTQTIRVPATRAGMKLVEDEMYEVLRDKLIEAGRGATFADDAIKYIKEQRELIKTFTLDDIAQPTDFGLAQRLYSSGIIDLDRIAAEMSARAGRPIDPAEVRFIMAQTAQELFSKTLVLPDWRQINILANNPYFKVFRKGRKTAETGLQVGERNAIVEFGDIVVAKWKNLNLANLGYLARNLLDGQTALYMGDAGIYSLFNRPFQYFKVLRKRMAVEDALNEPMTSDQLRQLAKRAMNEMTPAEREFAAAGRAQSWGTYKEQLQSIERLMKTGDVDRVFRGDGAERYAAALTQAQRKIYADPLERLLARLHTLPDDVKQQRILDWLYMSDEGKMIQSEIIDAYREKGAVLGLPRGMQDEIGQYARADLSDPENRLEFWKAYIDTVIRGRTERMADIPELRIMMSHNFLPALGPDGRVVVTTLNNIDYAQVSRVVGDRATNPWEVVGGIYRDPDTSVDFFIDSVNRTASGWEFNLIELKMIDYPTAKPSLRGREAIEWARKGGTDFDALRDETIGDTAVRLVADSAWSGPDATMSESALEIAKRLYGDSQFVGQLPEWLPIFREAATEVGTITKAWRGFVDKVFIGAFFGAENALEKLPAFRQFKWGAYFDQIETLPKEELIKLRDNIASGAKRLDMSVNDYVGEAPRLTEKVLRKETRWQKLNRLIDETPAGPNGYTLEQLDQYAAVASHRQMRQFFYDAPKRLNFETADGLEYFFTFIAATRSIMQRFARLAVKNPDKPYRMIRAFNGATDLQLPGDSDVGLTYQDPITQQWKFRHPIGMFGIGQLLAKAAGIEGASEVSPIIGSPLKNLSIGLNGIPAINPMGAVPLNLLAGIVAGLTDSEDKLDQFRDIFLPFEQSNKDKGIAERLFPNWLNNAFNLFKSATTGQQYEKIQQELGDAIRALYASGKYDVNTADGRKKLEDDARRMAMIVTALSIGSQVAGPAAGQPDYFVDVNGVDVNASAVTAYYQRLKEQDPETATLVFVNTIGEQFLLYTVGKTTAIKNDAGGFIMTQKYVDWVRKNKFEVGDLTSGVGYYFGPPDEDEFSFNARAYLFDKGMTRYRQGNEYVPAGQNAIAAMKYRLFRNALPTYLNRPQQQMLREYRQELGRQYAAYSGPIYEVNKFNSVIKDIERVLKDDMFENAPLVEPLRAYMIRRQTLLMMNGKTTFRSKAMTDARLELDSYAEQLARISPEFSRLYDRVLASETDPAGFDTEIND